MEQYFKELDTPIFQAHLDITQTGGSGGDAVINIYCTNSTRLLLKSIQIKASGTLGGTRYFYINQNDTSNNTVCRLAYAVGLNANNNLTFPHGGNIQSNNSSGMQEVILMDDSIQISANLGSNEGFEVILRGLVRGRLPTYNTSGSTGSVSVSSDYYKAV